MKARYEDGEVTIYGELPSKLLGVTGNYAGGFHLVDVDTQQQEGFFDVEEPTYNKILEVLSPIYFDEEKRVFTYKVEPKPGLPTLEQAKKNKIQELKMKARDKFSETDWYYTRSLRMKELGLEKEIPLEVIEQSERIYALLDKKEQEINNIGTGDDLADLEAVLTYDTSVGDTKAVPPISPEKILDPETELKTEPEAEVETPTNPTDTKTETETPSTDSPTPPSDSELPAGDVPDTIPTPNSDVVPEPVIESTTPITTSTTTETTTISTDTATPTSSVQTTSPSPEPVSTPTEPTPTSTP